LKVSKAILVVNSGSSSLKYEVYEMPEGKSLGKGTVERIGMGTGNIGQSSPKGEYILEQEIRDHGVAMELVRTALIDKEKGILGDLSEIVGVGHRVVHGGERYSRSVVIDDQVLEAIKDNIELAPLHNPANLTGIMELMRLLPGVPEVAVFDTAFHQTIQPSSYLYGIPYELYEKYKIRKYGFHGTSHRYVSGEAMRMMKRVTENSNVISAHLGNGASITAIAQGKSIDTSMGFTPLEGLIMGTRSGDIDPAIIFYLMERGYSAEELNSMLNKKSGLLGISGISNDMRDLQKASAEGITRAEAALEVFAHRVRRYIGAYMADLVKVDALIFTGGVGQHDYQMRERICRRLENLGIVMDYEKNRESKSRPGVISADYSPVTILVIPTNEELQIAMDTYDLVFGARG